MNPDGILMIPNWLNGFRLADLRHVVAEGFRKAKIRDTAESSLNRTFLEPLPPIQDFLKESRLSEAVGHFAGPFPLPRADFHAHRLYPYDRNAFGAYRWHYDGHPGWPIKAMLLLTDLDVNGQAMEYIKGVPTKREFASYEETRWPDETQPPGEVVPVVGKAGTLWLFDAWNWHRGVRKMAPIRDTLTVEWLKFL